MLMNRIHIEQLKVMASIGCEPFEHHIKQPLFFDIEFEVDLKPALKSDELKDTVDYTLICEAIEQITQEKHYQLIENLAQTVCDTLISRFGLKKLCLKLSKPTAIKNAQNVSVSIQQPS